MTDANRKKLIDELSDALGSINSAECVYIRGNKSDCPIARDLGILWYKLYHIRKAIQDGSVYSQSAGEPEKTA